MRDLRGFKPALTGIFPLKRVPPPMGPRGLKCSILKVLSLSFDAYFNCFWLRINGSASGPKDSAEPTGGLRKRVFIPFKLCGQNLVGFAASYT